MLDGFRDWLTGLGPGFFLLIWAGSAGLTLLFIFLGFRYLIRARIIAHTPTARLRSAAQGFNEIEGTGRPLNGEPLRSPLTFTPCLWFDISIERRESSGNNRRWVTEERHRSDQLFLVDDGTGEAFVDPDHARVIEHETRRWKARGLRQSASPSLFQGFGDDYYRYTERLLLPDRPLYVLGWLETRGHGQLAHMTEAIEQRRRGLLGEWKARDEERARFDLDGDGEISQREWRWAMRLARAQAEKEVREADAERLGSVNVVNLMRRPATREPFIVSGLSQHDLVRRKTVRAAGLLGGAFGLFLIWFLVQATRTPF